MSLPAGGTCLNDGSFGPAVQGCRGDFDFTVLFELIFFSIIPSGCFIIGATSRSFILVKRLPVARGFGFLGLKQVFMIAYASLCLSFLILVSSEDVVAQPTAIAASVIGLLAAISLSALSWLEHRRSVRPSFLLFTFLSITLLLDVARSRTLLLNNASSSTGRLYAASTILKAALLLLELFPKRRWLWTKGVKTEEETSGPVAMGFYSWLNGLLLLGRKKALSLDDLPKLSESLRSTNLGPRFIRIWNESKVDSRSRLIIVILRALKYDLLYPVLPRLFKTAFTFCQPFLIQGILRFLQKPESEVSANDGYGFIGATFLVYGGIAVSTAAHTYLHRKALAKLRSCLVNSVFEQTTMLSISASDKTATLTLMSTDVERIKTGLLWVHEVWASTLEAGLAAWLLERQLGLAFLVPLGVIVFCILVSMVVAGMSGKPQSKWMQITQRRIGVVSASISSMKSIKMLGLTELMGSKIQQIRVEELKAANVFRFLIGVSVLMSAMPLIVAPPLTFAATSRTLDTDRVFTSLAFLLLLSNPLLTLMQILPSLVSAKVCADRISNFLQLPRHQNTRLVSHPEFAGEEAHKRGTQSQRILVRDGTFAYQPQKPILKGIDIAIPIARFTIIVGPVGSGKSTLCKALLGEVPILSGTFSFPPFLSRTAFCDQTPFLPNVSIRDCILGFSPVDMVWYQTVLRATDLLHDLDQMHSGDQTIIGSGGVALSGGQKARIALARAVYSRAPLIVLDDVFSGLDKSTEGKVFTALFGQDGLLRRGTTTSIISTHNTKHLRHADHIVALGSDGSVVEEGTFADLLLTGRYISRLDLSVDTQSDTASVNPALAMASNIKATLAVEDIDDQAKRLGDFAVYRHYFGTFGSFNVTTLLLNCVIFGFVHNFGTVWLKYWADQNDTPGTRGRRHGLYLGVFMGNQFLEMVLYALFIWHNEVHMASRAGRVLHSQALATVMNASLKFFSSTDAGDTVTRFSQDMTIVDAELPLALGNTVSLGAIGIGQAVVIAIAAPYVAIGYPFLIFTLYWLQRYYLRTSRQLRFLDLQAKAPLYTLFQETGSGLATIRAFGWMSKYRTRSHELLDDSQRPDYLLAMVQQWLTCVLDWIIAVIATVLVTLATQLRSNAGFTSASLISLMTWSNIVTVVIRYWTMLETSVGAVSRLKSFGERVHSEHRAGEDLKPPEDWPREGVIHISNASASYNGQSESSKLELSGSNESTKTKRALHSVNLSIRSGEKVAICGRTGSGKSSLILMLLRLLDPISDSSTRITMDGIDLMTIDRNTLRKRIITIPQDPLLLPDGSSWEENLDPYSYGIKDDCKSILEKIGLWNVVEAAGGLCSALTSDALSHGQKQLFCLARAVLQARARVKLRRSSDQDDCSSSYECPVGGIVLLDEISSSVDKATDDLMQQIIRREFKHYTIIAVAHRLETVMDFDRAVLLDSGRIKEVGPAREVLRKLI